jgi:ATP-dependent Clp protease adaptor protein ClpS
MSVDVDIKIDEKIKREVLQPKKYKVVFLNDDHTPVEWVIGLLTEIYKHSQTSAEQITMTIHTEGSGVVGIYSFEIAEQKVAETISVSRNHGFPLQVKMEEDA